MLCQGNRVGGSRGLPLSCGGVVVLLLPLLWLLLGASAGAESHGQLGVFIQNASRLPESSGVPQRAGAVVLGVMRNGPAEQGGIQRGDVIVQYDDQPVRQVEDLQRLVSQSPLGHTAVLEVIRRHQTLTIPVKVESVPASLPVTRAPDMGPLLLEQSEVIWIVLVAVAVGLFIVYLASAGPRQRQRPPRSLPDERGRLRLPVGRHVLMVAITGLLAAVLLWTSITRIDAGHRGVVFHLLHGVRGAVLGEGAHFLLPVLNRVSVYDLRPRVYEVRDPAEPPESHPVRPQERLLWTPTADGLKVGIDLSVRYRLDPSRLPELHRSVGPEFEEKIVHPIVWNVTRLVASEYSLLDIYGKQRNEMQQQAFARIQALFARDGLICEALLLQDVVYTDDFEKTLVSKMIAEQKVQESAFEVEQAQLRAQAQVLEAHGEAEALALINDAIRDQPLLLRYLWIRNLPERLQIIVVPNHTGKARAWMKPRLPDGQPGHSTPRGMD